MAKDFIVGDRFGRGACTFRSRRNGAIEGKNRKMVGGHVLLYSQWIVMQRRADLLLL